MKKQKTSNKTNHKSISALKRLQKYYAYLRNSQAPDEINNIIIDSAQSSKGLSILELSEICSFPIEIVRTDIDMIMRWNILREDKHSQQALYMDYSYTNKINIDYENPTTQTLAHIFNLEKELENYYYSTTTIMEYEKISVQLIRGSLDTMSLFIEDIRPMYHIHLSDSEANALYSFIDEAPDIHNTLHKLSKKHPYRLFTKDSSLHYRSYNNLHETLDRINAAIELGNSFDLSYYSRVGRMDITFRPAKIAYDASENLYYVLYADDGEVYSLRLDRFRTLKDSKAKLPQAPEAIFEKAMQTWGMQFNYTPEDAYTVKVKFYDEANVIAKVKSDLYYRIKDTPEKLYKKNGCYYYEDTVYGISKFRAWIYGFGSSAIVLKPQSLREDIIRSYKARQGK